MNNESKIKGDGNYVIQGTKKSKINIENGNRKLSNKQRYTWIGILIAVVGLFATIIIGWDNIIKFFTK